MRGRLRWVAGAGVALLFAAAAALLGLTPVGGYLRNAPSVAAGYTAKLICSGVFVAGRDPDRVMLEDILPVDPLLRYVRIALDRDHGEVTASLAGLAPRRALYRPGLGCTLVGKVGEAALRAQAEGVVPMQMRERPAPWPAGDKVEARETPALAAALDAAFADGSGSRAVIVVRKDRIVAERYAPGFTKDMRFLGWSMAKSVNATLVGAMVTAGKLALDAPAPVAAWRDAADGRQAITLRQLLTMTSGLHFREYYQPGDNATAMFYQQDDMAAYAEAQPLDHPPGQVWSYSSGSANILGHLVFDAAGGTAAAAYNFARTHLFEPAGMTSAVFEPDGSGSPVGSSYVYMTARDWARFGLIYLDDGLLGWQRILPQSWVAEAHRPASLTGGGTTPYGFQFWLNDQLAFPDCPKDLYEAEGHNGQWVAIIPSAQAVIVRLGWTVGDARSANNRQIAAILKALSASN